MKYTKEQVQFALMQSWSKSTSHNPNEWSVDNPARGQCAVSALIVQELLGGELEKVRAVYHGVSEGHFRNVVDGEVLDTTRSQYPEDQKFEHTEINLKGFATAREKLLADVDAQARYEILKNNVLSNLK